MYFETYNAVLITLFVMIIIIVSTISFGPPVFDTPYSVHLGETCLPCSQVLLILVQYSLASEPDRITVKTA